MYDYRKMSPEEREQILSRRKSRGFPWHAPPHFGGGKQTFLINGACFDHQPILASIRRLDEFADALLSGLRERFGTTADAWVVQPNHYHILVRIDLDIFRPWIGRLHNGKSTQWNREDGTPKRRVWFRFSDRRIRSERHYYATLNYIHPFQSGKTRIREKGDGLALEQHSLLLGPLWAGCVGGMVAEIPNRGLWNRMGRLSCCNGTCS